MSSRLQSELKKSHPFDSLEQELFISILRAADHLSGELSDLLKPFNLSPTQYNVLRILRGSEQEGGLACREIAQRMITRDPDITRLLDRLEGRQLVARQRQTADRRVIRTCITPAGLELLGKLDEPIRQLHLRQLSHLGQGRLRQLIDLLDAACAPPGVQ